MAEWGPNERVWGLCYASSSDRGNNEIQTKKSSQYCCKINSENDWRPLKHWIHFIFNKYRAFDCKQNSEWTKLFGKLTFCWKPSPGPNILSE